MIQHNWLASYETIEGIETILMRMDYRTKYKGNMSHATHELKLFYNEFESEFLIFFTELINICKQKTNELHELL